MIEVFTDQAYNLILLAEDEARMLGRAEVEPKHVLLALARHGNGESLLAERGITATDLYRVISRTDGIGDRLVFGSLPRSPSTEEAMVRAVDVAAERGVLGPSSEYLLVGLGGDREVAAILREVGVDDVRGLVDARYATDRPPLDSKQVHSYAVRAASSRTPPRPGPAAPVFERFTRQVRDAYVEADRSAEDIYIEPFHLLLGLLQFSGSVAHQALTRHEVSTKSARSRAGRENPRISTFRSHPPHVIPPPPEDQVVGIPAESTRRVFSEEALKQAHMRNHRAISTGHVLLGLIDIDDPDVSTALGADGIGQAVAATAASLLPGDETPSCE